MTQLNDTSLDGNPNLLAHYIFDTGALTTDSADSRTLTNNNTVGETANGKYGYAADFGESNTDKRFTRAEDIWANGAFSVVAWAKRANTTDNHGISECNDSGTNKQLLLNIQGANLNGQIYRLGTAYDTISAALNTNDTEWHHYALTLTTGAGGTLRIYQDGVELANGAVTNSSGSVDPGETFVVGYSDGSWMEGYLDDVAFFSDVLTPEEIAELAANPSSGFFAFF